VDLLGYPAVARLLLGGATALIGVMLFFRAASRMGAARGDARALIRSVRLVFLAVAAFAAAAGWFLGSALPIVVALIIAVVDVVETTFMLAVTASRTAEGTDVAQVGEAGAVAAVGEDADGARPDEGMRPEGY
jgi:hypothetical protein